MLKYLLEKEFKQLLRDSFFPRLIFMFPCLMILFMPWAATLEIENIKLAVVDSDRSAMSGRLVRELESSDYFRLVSMPASYDDALHDIERGRADIVLEIPHGFEKDYMSGASAGVQISANAVDGTKGVMGSSYLSQILSGNAGSISVRYMFNQHLDYKLYMVPALMVIVIMMISGFLPALNIVGEKEKGTIEQINVTPVTKVSFTMSKLLPYWAIGLLVLAIMMLLSWVVYGIVPAGSVVPLYLGCFIFILIVSGMGVIISNYASTMQQAMFVTWFFVLILVLMSGLFTPVSSMPEWARYFAKFNPLTYFMEIMRMVYIKGSGFADMLRPLGALAAFALLFDLWAVASYRKMS